MISDEANLTERRQLRREGRRAEPKIILILAVQHENNQKSNRASSLDRPALFVRYDTGVCSRRVAYSCNSVPSSLPLLN